jgi:hypothetical protein
MPGLLEEDGLASIVLWEATQFRSFIPRSEEGASSTIYRVALGKQLLCVVRLGKMRRVRKGCPADCLAKEAAQHAFHLPRVQIPDDNGYGSRARAGDPLPRGSFSADQMWVTVAGLNGLARAHHVPDWERGRELPRPIRSQDRDQIQDARS